MYTKYIMMTNRKNQTGFTIVELLIVIVIIAILASIVIVAFNGIQGRARESEVKAGVGQSKKKLQLYQIDNGSYPATGNLAAAGVTNGSVTYQYAQTGSGTGFCLTGTKSGTAATITESTAVATGTCSGHGANGLPASPPNLIANPSFETNTSGWVVGNPTTTTIARVASGSGIVSGSAAMEVTAIGSAPGVDYQIAGLSTSTTYTVSLYIYVVNKGPSNELYLEVVNTSGGNCYQSIGIVAGASTRMTCTWTSAASPGTTTLHVYEPDPSGAGLQFRIDAVMVEAGSTLNAYHD